MKQLNISFVILILLHLVPIVVSSQDSIDTSKLYGEYRLDYYPVFVSWSLNSQKFDKLNSTGEFSTVVNKIVKYCTDDKYSALIFDGASNHLSGTEPWEMRENPWIEIVVGRDGKANLQRGKKLEQEHIFTECLKKTFSDAQFNPGLINGTPVKSVMMYILKAEL